MTGDNDYVIVLMCKYFCYCINLEIVISVSYLIKRLKSKSRGSSFKSEIKGFSTSRVFDACAAPYFRIAIKFLFCPRVT